MRFDIRYVTRFRYAGEVTESQNELRACPVNDDRQLLVHYDVTTTPSSRIVSYVDYWGTRVDTFGIRPPHDHLEVVAEATVETRPGLVVPPRGLTRAALQAPAFVDAHFAFLQSSPHANGDGEVARVAHAAADEAGTDLVDVVLAIHHRVAELEYRPGSTTVGVDVGDVLRAGSGVCQDFAHLAVAMYRAVGVPARYVSGYLFAAADDTGVEAVEDEINVQTHAWVEAAVPGWGWLALDPTNLQPVGERHVTIGRGRDYDDVAPFRGAFSGPAEHELEAVVTMRRLTATPRTAAARDQLAQQQQ
jgi:transglutaminase-like putative cysteine protease